MKKRVIIIFGVLIILATTWIGYNGIKKLNKKVSIRNSQNDLTQILNGLSHTISDEAPFTILIFFNSGCEHCQWVIQEISKKIDQFSNHQLLLASFEPELEAISFLNRYGLSDYYIKSTPEKVMTSFSGGVPQTLIYRDGKLVKHFKGEVKTEAILEVLEEE